MKGIVASGIVFGITAAGCSGAKSSDENVFDFRTAGYVIQAGAEVHKCFILNVPTGATSESAVGLKRVVYTPGSPAVHHMVVFSDPDNEGDGTRDCGIIEGSWNVRFAAGLTAETLETPAGTAIPVGEIETWVIQLHYVNASDEAVSDDTSVRIEYTKPGEEFIPADLVITGSQAINLAPMTSDQQVVGTCDVPQGSPDMNVFAYLPHMHRKGTHFKIERVRGGSTTAIHDAAYDFNDQPLYQLEESVGVIAGDQIITTCTYDNDTTEPIGFGESTEAEMCFAFVFTYPAVTEGSFPCL